MRAAAYFAKRSRRSRQRGGSSRDPRLGIEVLSEAHGNLLDPDVVCGLLQRSFSIDLLIDFTEVRLAMELKAAARAALGADVAAKTAICNAIDRIAAAILDGDSHEAETQMSDFIQGALDLMSHAEAHDVARARQRSAGM